MRDFLGDVYQPFESADSNYGISDILDAVSKGVLSAQNKLPAGHGKRYWEEDPTRVYREVFADITALEMTNSGAEIDFLKSYMSDVYSECEKLWKKL